MLVVIWILRKICLFEFIRIEGAQHSWNILKGDASYESLGTSDIIVCYLDYLLGFMLESLDMILLNSFLWTSLN
jgi:hypothetical protein